MMDLKPVLQDNALYLGDNGRCLCGKCSGASARFTGRDISGQKVHKVTKTDRAYCSVPLRCEGCGSAGEPETKAGGVMR